MLTATLSNSAQSLSLYKKNIPSLKPNHLIYNQTLSLSPTSTTFNGFHHLSALRGFSVGYKGGMMNTGRRFGAVCYSSPLTPPTLQWVSTISSAVLMFARGTGIQKSFLVPIFALLAPAGIVSWIKGEYGIWTAFLALVIRIFFFIPGELELPFLALLVLLAAPNQVLNIRGRQEGVILSLVIAGYLAFQHFSRAGSLRKAFDQGSIIATIAVTCVLVVPCLLLIRI